MPRKLVLSLSTRYCGSDGTEYIEVLSDATDDDIEKLVDEYAFNNAEMYGLESIAVDEAGEDFEDNDNISGSWVDYDPEVHGPVYKFIDHT